MFTDHLCTFASVTQKEGLSLSSTELLILEQYKAMFVPDL
jgi:hypothetical protein